MNGVGNPINGTIGLIGCRMFEDEIAYLISSDPHIHTVHIVSNDDSKDLVGKLKSMGLENKISTIAESDIPRINKDNNGLSLFVWLKPMALHNSPEKLREDILLSIKSIENICNSILLFYGLCGNAFKHLAQDTEGIEVPVTILVGTGDQVVDDCIGAVLGGTDEYYQLLKKSSGTFFLTPMWAANWRELFHKVQILPDPNDVEGARFIFKEVGYKRVCKMETNLGDQELFKRDIDEFAELFNFNKGSVACTMDVIISSYNRSKKALN